MTSGFRAGPSFLAVHGRNPDRYAGIEACVPGSIGMYPVKKRTLGRCAPVLITADVIKGESAHEHLAIRLHFQARPYFVGIRGNS